MTPQPTSPFVMASATLASSSSTTLLNVAPYNLVKPARPNEMLASNSAVLAKVTRLAAAARSDMVANEFEVATEFEQIMLGLSCASAGAPNNIVLGRISPMALIWAVTRSAVDWPELTGGPTVVVVWPATVTTGAAGSGGAVVVAAATVLVDAMVVTLDAGAAVVVAAAASGSAAMTWASRSPV